MKKSFFLSFLVFVLIIISSNTMYADAWSETRKKCNGWNLWGKYRANAVTGFFVPVFPFAIPDCGSNKRNCGGIYPENMAECNKRNAKAQCYNYSGTASIKAEARWEGGIPHFAGSAPSQLYGDVFEHVKFNFLESGFAIADWEVAHNLEQLTASSRTLVLSSTNKVGRNIVSVPKGSKMKAVVRVDLWKAEDDNINQVQDTSMTPNKIFHTEYIVVTQDGVEMSKGISDLNPAVTITSTEVSVDLSAITLSMDIPAGINIEDELVMRLTSDVIVDEQASFLSIKQNSDGNKVSELTISSNPSSGFLSLTIVPKVSTELLKVRIYDINGRFLDEIFSDKADKNEFQLTRDISNYSDGIYIITLSGDAGTLVMKKVVLKK